MKQILLTSCAVFSLGAAPAFAEEHSSFDQKTFYAAVFGGVNLLQNSDVSIDPQTSGIGSTTGKIDFDTGFVVGGAVGVVFAPYWRGEVELSYRRNEISSFFEGSGTQALNPANYLSGSDDHISAFAIMGNIWRDIEITETVGLHVGGGAGLALIHLELADADGVSSLSQVGSIDDSDWVFAGQLGAGLDWEMHSGWIASLDYRAFIAESPSFTGSHTNGGTFGFETDYISHSVMVGLRMPLSGH